LRPLKNIVVEHLEHRLDETEEAFDKFYKAISRAANYAQKAHGYRGKMFETVDPELLAEDNLDEEAGTAYRWKSQLEDELFQLEGDIQAFLDGRDDMPERVEEIDTRMGQMRDMYRELETELKIITGEKLPEEDVEA